MQKRLRFTKRTLALALVLVMALGMFPLMAAASDYEDHWSKEFIEDAMDRGWMKGYEDGTFRPESSITRAEFAVMLWRAYGEPEPENANPFIDVPVGEWYDSATAALFELGITSGVGDNRFDPSGTLTREMGMTMLSRAFGIEAEDADSYKSFDDAALISDWAAAAISALVENGYVNGVGDNQFAPQNPLKRGEMARILAVTYDGEGGFPAAEGGDKNITITLSCNPTATTTGNVTVTVTASSENGAIKFIGTRKSSAGAKYENQNGFTDITTASRFTVAENGWYAVGVEDATGAFAYKLINITNIVKGGGSYYGGPGAPTIWEVTFDPAGGLPIPGPVDVEDGKALTSLPIVTKDGFTLDGWYLGTVKWTTSMPVTSDMHLVAKWIKNSGAGVYEVAGEFKAWIDWTFDITSVNSTFQIFVEFTPAALSRLDLSTFTIGGNTPSVNEFGHYFVTIQIPKAEGNAMKTDPEAQEAYLADAIDFTLEEFDVIDKSERTTIYVWSMEGTEETGRTYAYVYLTVTPSANYKVYVGSVELSLVDGRYINLDDTLVLAAGDEVAVTVVEVSTGLVTDPYPITVIDKIN